MPETIRLMVKTRDRIGMALDLLRVLYKDGINLKTMEVKPGVAYMKVNKSTKVSLEHLQEQLLLARDVEEVKVIEFLPHELREREIRTVLDTAGEGIIAINKYGTISAFNPAAEKILGINAEKALNKSIADVLAPDLPILKTVRTGESYDNVEIILHHKHSSTHYVTSGRPIIDDKNNIIGAVAILQDMESVMSLIHSLTRPTMITFDEILGESNKITEIKEMARIVAKSNSTVLIRGESGTGKELFARSIHAAGPRKEKPFVPVNCAALPDTLLESELFGYEEGAFTGASRNGRQGLFKYADRGTIFLDEIAELSPHLQVKLLRVLQEGAIRRVGGNKEIPVDVRIIAATNRNLEELMHMGHFREDLFYRLNVIPLYIPPLREIKEDIPILAEHFLQKLGPKINKTVTGISGQALQKMENYNWPGNVRELSNVIERAMNLATGSNIEIQHLILENRELKSSFTVAKENEQGQSQTLKDIVAEAEKKAITEALEKYKSIRKAAAGLGVTHGTIINKINRYNIKRNDSTMVNG